MRPGISMTGRAITTFRSEEKLDGSLPQAAPAFARVPRSDMMTPRWMKFGNQQFQPVTFCNAIFSSKQPLARWRGAISCRTFDGSTAQHKNEPPNAPNRTRPRLADKKIGGSPTPTLGVLATMISDHSASPEGAGTQAGGVGAWPDETPSMDMCSPSMALAAVRNAVSSLAKYAASPAISHR